MIGSGSELDGPDEQFSVPYRADLLGNIRQILAGLKGYEPMALELIQNADDSQARRVTFCIDDDALRIESDSSFSNCGFSKETCPWVEEGRRACDFHALSTVGSSAKMREAGQIGRFGIGFVSVYQITDTPVVRSGVLELTLNPATERNSACSIAMTIGTSFELRWAREDTYTRQQLISSTVPDNVCDLVQEALLTVTRTGLIFLRHVNEVQIQRSGKLVTKIEIVRDEGHIAVAFSPSDELEEWLVLEADARDRAGVLVERFPEASRLQRRTDISVAFPLHATPQVGKLYAYLPTEQASRLPAHINGDFFPHQDRRKITLDGEGLDRFWNEMLLDAAAKCIADNLILLRNRLGYRSFWQTLHEAYDATIRDIVPAFGVFWKELGRVVPENEIVFTAASTWVRPATSVLGYLGITKAEEIALSQVGIDIVHGELRPFYSTLRHLRVPELGAAKLAEELSAKAPAYIESVRDIADLWSAANKVLSIAPTAVDESYRARLMATPFVKDDQGAFVPPEAAYKVVEQTNAGAVSKAFPGLCLLSTALNDYPKVAALAPRFDALAAAREIARRMDGGEALGCAGDAPAQRGFYDVLGCLEVPEEDKPAIAHILNDVEFLRGGSGLIAPRSAQFPGGFSDPTGSLSILDRSVLTPKAESFVRDVLSVQILAFAGYVEHHLDRILKAGLTDDQYTSLLRVLVDHLTDIALDAGKLSDLPLVRTRGGQYASARSAYFKTNELAEVLGDDDRLWVDTRRLPAGMADLVKTLFTRIGMRAIPAADHLIDRIEEVVSDPPTRENRESINRVAGFLQEHLSEYGTAALSRLKTLDWLPAVLKGAPDLENWYPPHDIYRFFRSEAFASQVAVVDLPALRSNQTAAADLMRVLEVGIEPDTSTIVAHLEYCIAQGIEPKDTVYQILWERLRDDNDVVALERLRGRPFIYDSATKRFLPATRVFWQKPPFGRYWTGASVRMGVMERLFRHLGVEDQPTEASFCELLHLLAERDASGGAADHLDHIIHDAALDRIAELVAANDNDAILRELESFPCLLTRAGGFRFASEAAWCDDESATDLFGSDLVPFLVSSPLASPALRMLLQKLGVRPLSRLLKHRVAALEGEEALPEHTARLLDRADLLLWLVPTGPVARRLRRSLEQLTVQRVDLLTVVAEFSIDDEPVISPPRSSVAFFDRDAHKLYVCCGSNSEFDWPAALKAIFADAAVGTPEVDIKQLALIATLVLEEPSRDTARARLLSVGFAPPQQEVEIEEGGELDDFDDTDLEPAPEEFGEEINEQDSTTDQSESAGGAEPAAEAGDDHRSSEHSTRERDQISENKGNNHQNDGGDQKPKREQTPGQQRKEWMRSYVRPNGATETENSRSDTNSDQSERNSRIDEAAMAAVLKYEEAEGRFPERKSHTNPGYDILSMGLRPSDTRYIEVKGLNGDWNGRGVKLSPTQFQTAHDKSERFWIYVVENALDADSRQIYPIRNPFEKVDEYWFDDAWRGVSEKIVSNIAMRLHAGAKVRHPSMRDGIVEKVDKTAGTIVANFTTFGKRAIVRVTEIEIIDD